MRGLRVVVSSAGCDGARGSEKLARECWMDCLRKKSEEGDKSAVDDCWGIGEWWRGAGSDNGDKSYFWRQQGNRRGPEDCKLIPPARQRPLATLERLSVQVMRAVYF